MQKRFGLILIIFLLFLDVQSQPRLNLVEADRYSYELFLKGEWLELIDYAASVRREGIDFFYLQVRTGIAYYNMGKYRLASEWFLKAYENNQDTEWLQEYLYYSLLFGGRQTEAFKAAGDFSEEMQDKIDFTFGKVTRVAVEAGYCFNPGFDDLVSASHDIDAEVGTNYGEAFYLKNYQFESFDLSHRITPGFSLNHNLTYININREERVDWYGREDFSVTTNQFQYFISPHFILSKKLYFSPSLSLIWGRYGYAVGGFNGYNIYFDHQQNSYFDHVFSASVWSHFGNFSPGGEFNLAHIGDDGLSQYSAWITYYPFSHTDFYFSPRIYFRSEHGEGFRSPVAGISGGVRIGPVHLEGQYLAGEMENFIESAGYVVSNFPGTSKHKFTGSLYFPADRKYQVVIRYINQDITETYQVYSNYEKSNAIYYNFVKHTLTAGVTWNFLR